MLRVAIDDLTTGITRGKLLLYAGELLAIGLAGGHDAGEGFTAEGQVGQIGQGVLLGRWV